MISLEELKKIEPALEKVPNEKLEEIRNLLYAQAQLSLECFLENKSDSKKIALGSQQTEDEMKKLPPCKMEK